MFHHSFHLIRSISRPLRPRCAPRSYSSGASQTSSRHAQWYADIVPAMVPIALLGSAVYLGLQLAQSQLSHEQYLDEARARVKELEAEVAALQKERQVDHNRSPVTASTAASRGWFWKPAS